MGVGCVGRSSRVRVPRFEEYVDAIVRFYTYLKMSRDAAAALHSWKDQKDPAIRQVHVVYVIQLLTLSMLWGFVEAKLRREPVYPDQAVRAYLRLQQRIRHLPLRMLDPSEPLEVNLGERTARAARLAVDAPFKDDVHASCAATKRAEDTERARRSVGGDLGRAEPAVSDPCTALERQLDGARTERARPSRREL